MSLEKGNQDETTEPIIIQEKITKKNGQTIIKKYSRGKVLGKGGFATCYEITDLEKNRMLAAKVISKASLTKKRSLEKLLAEIKIHKSLQHESIVFFEHVFEDKENVYILLEVCPNQTLKEYLKKRKRLPEAECAAYIIQILNALKYLHQKKIIHRDLKLGNLFLGKHMEIKVGDFGLAAKIEQDGERRRTICGTPNYIAPEVLDKKQGHSFEVDIWSLGVICYTMLIGRPPFETSDTKATYRRIMKGDYSFPTSVQISAEAKDLIKKILVLDPAKRPNLDEIFDHPYIKPHVNKTLMANPTLDPNSSLKKSKELQTSLPIKNLTTTTIPEKQPTVVQNVITVSQVTNKEATQERDIDEQEIYGTTMGRASDRLPPPEKTKSDEAKQTRITPLSPRTFANNHDEREMRKVNAEIYVTKWVDYSNKYGFGYLLSDGTSGIVFRDATKVTFSADETKFEYIKKDAEQNREILYSYSAYDYPKELQKKVLLVHYFKNYLEGNNRDELDEIDRENNEHKLSDAIRSMPLVYVKKWFKTKHAILFKLNNRIVQVDFTDKTQIILSTTQQLVFYKDKHGQQTQHALATALESDYREMTKRLGYTKEILVHMKSPNFAKDDRAFINTIANSERPEKEYIDSKVITYPTHMTIKE